MKKIVLLTAICFAFSSCGEDMEPKTKERVDIPLTPAEKELAINGNNFGYNLFREINRSQVKPANTCLSPISVNYVFSMLNNGADGISRKEIQQVLGYGSSTPEEINAFNQKMLVASRDLDPQVTIETANSIWIRKEYPVLSSFTEVNKKYYQAEIQNVSFDSQTLNKINKWVSDRTHGKIPTILDEINERDVFYAMNALYFKGKWKEPFEKKQTKMETFTNADGSESEVPMMCKTLKTLYYTADQYGMIALPYGNSAFSMWILLPHQDVSLSSIISTLNEESWANTIRSRMPYQVNLHLPRFQVNAEIDLIEILKRMGMPSLFGKEADFSLINPANSLYLTLAKQKAALQVNEEGAEAAAVTIVGGDLTAVGPVQLPHLDFFVDRPFIYMIREISTGALFFMGEINQL